MNKVVARFLDGRVVRGITFDFEPSRPHFHINEVEALPGTKPVEVQLKDLKAVFFVKDFAGDPGHQDRKEFDMTKPPLGRRIRVMFRDGETLVGMSSSYFPGRPGFFLQPADADSNIQRCYVIAGSAQTVNLI